MARSKNGCTNEVLPRGSHEVDNIREEREIGLQVNNKLVEGSLDLAMWV